MTDVRPPINRPMMHVPGVKLIYKEQSEPLDDLSLEFEENRPTFLINTPSCKIPMILEQYNETKNIDNATCGERMVFLKRFDSDFIQVSIPDKAFIKIIAKDSEFHCCYYQFTSDKNETKETDCQDIRDGFMIRLEYDFVGVKCFETMDSDEERTIYEDVYAFVRNTGYYGTSACSNKFNVLIVGVNSMSLSRFSQTMPRTVNFFKDNDWLAFRGYHKLSDTNKIANLMTAFIGHDVYMGTEKCAFATELCHDPIWKTFEDLEYVTAFGEDYVNHPDSINKQYYYKDSSTYHYIHPLFQSKEREVNEKKLVCTGKKPSAQQLLDYAYDFALAYRQTPFFGFFWMNTFSKYVDNYRENADKMLEDFFTRLTYTGILKNTFVMLVSDHGPQHKKRPLSIEGFYDNQAPAFFMYLPEEFRRKFPRKPMTLKVNQFRLITLFDLYDTLYDISEIARCKKDARGSVKITESHQSLLDEVSGERTCEKVGIDFVWCSCNRLYTMEKMLPSNALTIKSVRLVQEHLEKRVRSTRTVSCTRCYPLVIKDVASLYYMINREKGYVYHIMSFTTTEGLWYDAIVCEKDTQLQFVRAEIFQTPSLDFGNCTIDAKDRQFCMCQKRLNCNRIKCIFCKKSDMLPKELTKGKSAKILLLVVPWVVITMYYYNNTNRLFGNTTEAPVTYQHLYYNDSDNDYYLINTPGCQIPNYMKTISIPEAKNKHKNCGHRAVFIKKIFDDTIQFRIDEKVLNTYKHKNKSPHKCCYAFGHPYRSKNGENDYRKVRYTTCQYFNNGTKSSLQEEIITVTCVQTVGKKSIKIYEDSYMLVKKDKEEEKRETHNKRWNILIVGMDSMSRARMYSNMPKTVRYFNEQKWLDYRGYQKIGYNTFPNIASLLTGMTDQTFQRTCYMGMDGCNKFLLWSELQQLGYKTAYGEDFIRLPDTFSRYDGFKNKPTDHYMRPLFLNGETTTGNTECTHKLTSVKHVLNYALDLSSTYRNGSYFGFFWLNSYSHNSNNNPKFLEEDLIDFFKSLNGTGALEDTFILFLSDHGIRSGEVRVQYQSYYDERLPMLFLWVPEPFRRLHREKYENLQTNQFRLVTPFDIHLTMWEIHRITNDSASFKTLKACPLCRSITKVISPYRKCIDAGVSDKWCSCHHMTKADQSKDTVKRSVAMVAEHLGNRSQLVKTVKCTKCEKLKLKHVHRVHTYDDNNKTYYVLAVNMIGDVGFETTVVEDNGTLTILQPTYTITAYNTRSTCTATRSNKEYCICTKLSHCHKPNR
ncbi:uncharacterized protein LOC121731878 [Aricia agestis]|uniref:uncharacterized protein LOC121731878 n=1 Tax=Aricia agestis TaxID=91739 RepID=UPI001C2047CE|nr:uncharacterized protein LOC121731878 [Aricia agestis]